MKAIDFIQQDIKKKKSGFEHQKLLIALLGLVTLAFGFFLRDDFGKGLHPTSFISAVLGFIALFMTFKQVYRQKTAWPFMLLVLVLSVFTAISQPSTEYVSAADFWKQTIMCFVKGVASTSMVGLIFTYFSFKFFSWPVRSQRLSLSLLSGLAGALMLEVHCDSSNWSHVLFGHLLQGFIAGLIIFGILESVFVWKVRKQLPAVRNIDNFQKLG